MPLSRRTLEKRAHLRARKHIAGLLPTKGPARARYGKEMLADALWRMCAEGDTAEGLWRGAKDAGERQPTGDLIHWRLKHLTHDDLLKAFHEVNGRILDYARRAGILPSKFDAALDSTRFGYWGKQKGRWVTGGPSKDTGSAWGFEYLTVDALTPGARLTLDLAPVDGFRKTGTTTDLIRRTFTGWWGSVDAVYLDRGFFQQETIQELTQLQKHFVMPAVMNPKLEPELKEAWRRNQTVVHTHLGKTPIAVVLAANPDYEPDQAASQGKRYKEKEFLAYVTNMEVEQPRGADLGWTDFWTYRIGLQFRSMRAIERPAAIANWLRATYRKRAGIETDYRVLKQDFSGWTTSNRASYRFLLFLVGVILRNLWVISCALADRSQAQQTQKAQAIMLTADVWKARIRRGFALNLGDSLTGDSDSDGDEAGSLAAGA